MNLWSIKLDPKFCIFFFDITPTDPSILQLPSFARDYDHPLQISTPFALDDVFSYLFVDEKIVLIDCGHYAGGSCEQVTHHLKEYGLTVNDLDGIGLTHGHPGNQELRIGN